MGAGLIIALLFIIGLVVGGYFLYKNVTTMYFSESFMTGGDEYAFQDISRYDKFKDKLEDLDENDEVKILKELFRKNSIQIYPKLKDNWVLGYICGKDTSFSKINKSLLTNSFDYFVLPKYMYNNSSNELQEIKYNNDAIMSFVTLTEDNFSGTNMLKDNIKKVI